MTLGPRSLGRISPQAEEYYRTAPPDVAEEIARILTSIEDDDREAWRTLTHSESVLRPGRVVVLMTNGDILVWQQYLDYAQFYALFYIGPPRGFGG